MAASARAGKLRRRDVDQRHLGGVERLDDDDLVPGVPEVLQRADELFGVVEQVGAVLAVAAPSWDARDTEPVDTAWKSRRYEATVRFSLLPIHGLM